MWFVLLSKYIIQISLACQLKHIWGNKKNPNECSTNLNICYAISKSTEKQLLINRKTDNHQQWNRYQSTAKQICSKSHGSEFRCLSVLWFSATWEPCLQKQSQSFANHDLPKLCLWHLPGCPAFVPKLTTFRKLQLLHLLIFFLATSCNLTIYHRFILFSFIFVFC